VFRVRSAVEQFTRVHLQGVGDQVDVVERDVALSTFDRAHIGAVQPGVVSEPLLREALLLSELAHFRAKSLASLALQVGDHQL
jgi:hypothetical protein